MKNLRLLFGLAIVVMAGFFASCEEEENGQELGPTLEFFSQGITTDTTVNTGDQMKWYWQAQKGDNNLESFTVTTGGANVSGFPKTDIDKDAYTDSVWIEAPLNEGSYKYNFVVTDKAGKTANESFTVTVEKLQVNMTSYSGVQVYGALGDQSNKDLFSVATGEVYRYNQLTEDQKDSIDLVYAYSDLKAFSNQLISPNDLPSDYHNGATLPNTTHMAKVDDVTFSEVTGNSIVNNIGDLTQVNVGITEGDVIAFKTQAGHIGYLKIKAIEDPEGDGWGDADDYIEFDVKAVLADDIPAR